MSTAAPRTRVPAPVRGWSDVALVMGGAAVLVLAALPVQEHSVGAAEAGVFRAINGVGLPIAVVWPVMQLGNLFAAPLAALVAALFRRWLLAAELLLAGAGVWVLAKVVKRIVVRGRPDTLLPDVVLRGAPDHGLAFVSGHAAVVTALAAVAWPGLGPRARVAGAVLASLVCLARVQVGAHLPLDVLGGAGLGLLVAGVVRLLLGRAA